MKKLLTLLAVFAIVGIASAQYVQGPIVINALTNAGTWTVMPADGGGAATNVPTTQAKWVPVGPNGFGVFIKGYGTNAALTTNVWITLEPGIQRPNGTIWPVSNALPVVVYLPTGTATNRYYTNFASTTLNLGNISAVRVKSIMQTNGVVGGSLAGALFVEEFNISTR